MIENFFKLFLFFNIIKFYIGLEIENDDNINNNIIKEYNLLPKKNSKEINIPFNPLFNLNRIFNKFTHKMPRNNIDSEFLNIKNINNNINNNNNIEVKKDSYEVQITENENGIVEKKEVHDLGNGKKTVKITRSKMKKGNLFFYCFFLIFQNV
jgi:hypothetical protein